MIIVCFNGHRTKYRRSMDWPLTNCPKCGGEIALFDYSDDMKFERFMSLKIIRKIKSIVNRYRHSKVKV